MRSFETIATVSNMTKTNRTKLTAAALESTISFVLAGTNHNVTAGQLHGLVCAQFRAQGTTRYLSLPTVAEQDRGAVELDRMLCGRLSREHGR